MLKYSLCPNCDACDRDSKARLLGEEVTSRDGYQHIFPYGVAWARKRLRAKRPQCPMPIGLPVARM